LPKGRWELALDSQARAPGDAASQTELPAQGTRIFWQYGLART